MKAYLKSMLQAALIVTALSLALGLMDWIDKTRLF